MTLLDPDGRPAEGFALSVFPPPFEGESFTSLEELTKSRPKLGIEPSIGAFYNLEGLSDAPHELAFCDAATRRVHRIQGVQPSARVLEFRLPPAPDRHVVEGRVLDLAGHPIEGANVFATARLSANEEH